MRKNPARTLIGTTVVVLTLLVVTILMGEEPQLGLDLQGGISVNLQPVDDAGEVTDEVTDDQLDQAIEIIRRRVDAVGVAEPEVSRQGSTITVQLPGARDQQEVLELVGRTAQLEFRPVLQVLPPTLSGEAREEAEARLEELRDELELPDGVTAQDVLNEEQMLQEAAAAEDPAAEGATPEEGVDDGAATEPPPEDGTDEGATGVGGGGRSAALPNQDEPTDPGEPVDPTEAPVAGEEPVELPDPLNQYGIGLDDERFGELLQLESQLDAELTPLEDQDENSEIVVPGEGGQVYRLGPRALTGEALEGATSALGDVGQWTVNPIFRPGAEGIDAFNAVAQQCFQGSATCPALSDTGNGLLGIVLDGEVISAPSINVPDFQREAVQISGAFTRDDADALAVALRFGALPIALEAQQAETVSATLGAGALRAGIISGLIGLGLAALYLFSYYRLLALVAVGSLAVSASFLWVIMSWLGATVTLAGVVGIVVSVGVTVDSAIVYFESLKERVLNGSTVRAGVDRSFDVAYATIIKANISSLIGAGVLYWLAVGPVRGFAFYLGAMTLLNLLATYVFVYPATAVIGRSRNGLHPRRLGIPLDDRANDPAGPSVAKTGATS